ncbi:MAG: hypothetical protein ACXWOV_18725 [Isosphaeraceae bacterium]
MEETGYGSDIFLRACRASAACRQIHGSGPMEVQFKDIQIRVLP